MAKKLAVLFGVVLVIVGVLGFIPNPIVGPTGFFMTNGLLQLAYFVIGVVLLIVAVTAPAKSGGWMKIFGVLYLLAAVLGFVMAPHGGAFIGLMANMATHWLHVVIGVVLLLAGFSAKRAAAPMAMPSGMGM